MHLVLVVWPCVLLLMVVFVVAFVVLVVLVVSHCTSSPCCCLCLCLADAARWAEGGGQDVLSCQLVAAVGLSQHSTLQ